MRKKQAKKDKRNFHSYFWHFTHPHRMRWVPGPVNCNVRAGFQVNQKDSVWDIDKCRPFHKNKCFSFAVKLYHNMNYTSSVNKDIQGRGSLQH